MGERDEYLRGCRDLCGWKSQLVQREGLVMPSLPEGRGPEPPFQNLLGHNKGTGNGTCKTKSMVYQLTSLLAFFTTKGDGHFSAKMPICRNKTM